MGSKASRIPYQTRHGRAMRDALLVALLIGCLLLVACASPGGQSAASAAGATPTATIPAKWRGTSMGAGGVPTVTPLANPAPRPLPAFSDPRVAYIGPDARLHVVSLDGKSDIAGTPIPLSGFQMVDGVWAAGASPDGRSLAYVEASQVTTVDAASGARQTVQHANVAQSAAFWSPDQRYLALDDGGAVQCVNLATGRDFETPGDPSAANGAPLVNGPDGWLDATHIAVMAVPAASGAGTHGLPPTVAPASPATYATLESLNITTNQLRVIASIQMGAGVGSFSVLPGGHWTLFTDAEEQSQPYTPLVALVNNVTGAVTPLRYLSALLPTGDFNAILWRPNSTQAVVTVGLSNTYLLIDALRDTATPLALPGVPEAWSLDGSTLVVATSAQGINESSPGWEDSGLVGAGPFTLTAVRIGAQGGVSPGVTLTSRAMDIPLLGFVHTA